ncbi:VOC family protein [Sphingopyxis sp. GW247-27LB]|uniref:VOC family protein n=1 Tax=Sphingopyxis sp. GW247-27LB TaxID=2012632 RepID=UPI000BA5D0D3|nr:VOC family protein [Sphingopyxis sp. GW247-27LB]PAL24239.1 bleomycin resistance protein [Sphingopyxis sp. GW247-27LB]
MSESDIRYKRLGYVWLNVTDLDRSRRFYTEIVGLALVGEDDGHVFLRCSDRHHDIILSQHREAGLKEIGWQMENARALEALRERFGADGIRTVSLSPSECETMRTDDGFWMTEGHTGARMRFYCHMEAAGGSFRPSHTRIARLGHVVLASPDMAATEKFFSDTMNFRVSDRIEGAVVHMRCFPNPLHHSFGIGAATHAQLHHVNFMVTDADDIGEADARMKQHDVPIVYGPGVHPQSGSMFFYYLDPDGLTLEYSFGMEEFPESQPRDPRLFPLTVESMDEWGAMPHPRFAKVGVIETA